MKSPSLTRRLILLSTATLGFAAVVSSSWSQRNDASDLEFREFTGANGKKIEAVIVDRDEKGVTMLMKNGQRLPIPFESLGEEDRAYAESWDKERAIFLQKCRSLTVRSLLELRGYESFKYRLQGNHITVQGEINGKPSTFLIDTGAGTSLLHLGSAEEAGCKIGAMDQKIYGVAGEAPAAWTEIDEIRLGETVIKDQRLLSTDLMKDLPAGASKPEDAIFGAEFLSQLRAVISYREGRVFLRPDLADGETVSEEAPDFRLFKMDDGTTYRANVVSKTSSAVNLRLDNGKESQLAISRLSTPDQEYVEAWNEEAATFMRHCRGLTVEELLELRAYQSFEYERKGNHIFVDGKLNEKETTFMIDTGGATTLLDVNEANEAKCQVGEMTEKIYGIGGEAPAAVTRVGLIQMGDAKIENRSLLSTDLFARSPSGRGQYGAIFGADFLRELDGVITYKENRIFLRRD